MVLCVGLRLPCPPPPFTRPDCEDSHPLERPLLKRVSCAGLRNRLPGGSAVTVLLPSLVPPPHNAHVLQHVASASTYGKRYCLLPSLDHHTAETARHMTTSGVFEKDRRAYCVPERCARLLEGFPPAGALLVGSKGSPPFPSTPSSSGFLPLRPVRPTNPVSPVRNPPGPAALRPSPPLRGSPSALPPSP